MRRALVIVMLAMVAACTASNIQKAQEVAALVKQNCHIAVSVADVAAALSAANPAITGVAAMARAICMQAQATGETGALDHFLFRAGFHESKAAQVEQPEPPPLPQPDPPMETQPEQVEPVEPPATSVPLPEPKDECVAVVNGVCIREEGDK